MELLFSMVEACYDVWAARGARVQRGRRGEGGDMAIKSAMCQIPKMTHEIQDPGASCSGAVRGRHSALRAGGRVSNPSAMLHLIEMTNDQLMALRVPEGTTPIRPCRRRKRPSHDAVESDTPETIKRARCAAPRLVARWTPASEVTRHCAGCHRVCRKTHLTKGRYACTACGHLEHTCGGCGAPEDAFTRGSDSSTVCTRCGLQVDGVEINNDASFDDFTERQQCLPGRDAPVVKMRDAAGERAEDSVARRLQNTSYVLKEYGGICTRAVARLMQTHTQAVTEVLPKGMTTAMLKNFVDDDLVARVAGEVQAVLHHMYVYEITAGVSKVDAGTAALRYVSVSTNGFFTKRPIAPESILQLMNELYPSDMNKSQMVCASKRLVSTYMVKPFTTPAPPFSPFAGSVLCPTAHTAFTNVVRQMVRFVTMHKQIGILQSHKSRLESQVLRMYAALSRLRLFKRDDPVVLNAFACIHTAVYSCGYGDHDGVAASLARNMGITQSWRKMVFGSDAAAGRRSYLMDCAAILTSVTTDTVPAGAELRVVMATLSTIANAHEHLEGACPRSAIGIALQCTLSATSLTEKDDCIKGLKLRISVEDLIKRNTNAANVIMDGAREAALHPFKLLPSHDELVRESEMARARRIVGQ
jgi:hypothetical protein